MYRAIGYFGSALPDVEFDHKKGVITNDGGRVLDADGQHVPGLYATGWIKRGPVGLIGHTKGCSGETVASLLEDQEQGRLPIAAEGDPDAPIAYLEQRGLPITTWAGWQRLDAHEIALGEPHGRKRIKVVDRDEMTAISRG